MKKIIIYSTPTCVYCNMAKDFLKKHNINYTDFNVAIDTEKRREMVEKTGQLGVPVIDIDGQVMVGFDEAALVKELDIK